MNCTRCLQRTGYSKAKNSMREIDAQIETLNKRLSDLETECKSVEAQIKELEEQKVVMLEHQWGIKRGEARRLSEKMRGIFETFNWWRVLRHGGYDPFTIKDLGENSVYIEDRMGGVCGMAYELVVECEKA